MEWLKNMTFYIEKQSLKKTTERVNSTNVDVVKWDSVSKDLVVKFDDGSVYTYFLVPEAIYNNIVDGLAGTKTAGEWGPVGSYPSVGASIWQYLVDGGFSYKKGGTI